MKKIKIILRIVTFLTLPVHGSVITTEVKADSQSNYEKPNRVIQTITEYKGSYSIK